MDTYLLRILKYKSMSKCWNECLNEWNYSLWVSLSISTVLLPSRWTWDVLCWGDRPSAGFADVLRHLYSKKILWTIETQFAVFVKNNWSSISISEYRSKSNGSHCLSIMSENGFVVEKFGNMSHHSFSIQSWALTKWLLRAPIRWLFHPFLLNSSFANHNF